MRIYPAYTIGFGEAVRHPYAEALAAEFITNDMAASVSFYDTSYQSAEKINNVGIVFKKL